MRYAEVGGWAVARESRCTSEGLLLALGAYSLGRALGGALGLTTATVRHSSSTILRRLGGGHLEAGGTAVPSYYDPRYRCEMELLRFDSRRPNAKYAGLIDTLAGKLTNVLVVANTVASDAFAGALRPWSQHEPRRPVTASLPQSARAAFEYGEAFSRNLGWVTEAEQQTLRTKRVALAGMGGVGGFHLLTLARLGVTRFVIADLDDFELANFNRQAGASMSTIGQPKVDVLASMARDINPDCEIEIFPDGVHAGNLERFFTGVDLYVDGLDAFAFEAREMVFAHCARARIAATTVAPLGMSAALLNFLPGGVSFEEYFQLAGRPELEKSIRFLVGVAPGLLHRHYLADRTRVNLAERRGPSTVIACQLCAGVAGGEALKLLLGRGKVLAAPWGVQFDAYRNRMIRTWRPGGNRHPLNRIAIALARRQLGI